MAEFAEQYLATCGKILQWWELLRQFRFKRIDEAFDFAITHTVRYLEQQNIPKDIETEDLLRIEKTGILTDEEARQLQRRLSLYFGRKGYEKVPKASLRKRGKKAAAKRWKKDDSSNPTVSTGS